MKKISERLYVIEPGVYADRLPDGSWRISDEQSHPLDGPFPSLEALQEFLAQDAESEAEAQRIREDRAAERIEADLDALDPDALPADAVQHLDDGTVVVNLPEAEDLVTLSEAAKFLPVTRQTMATARRRGTLGVPPVVTGRTAVLYSLKALKARYPE